MAEHRSVVGRKWAPSPVFRDLFSSLDLPDLPDEPGSRGRGSSSS
jgi:hypothetical protein